MSQYDKTKKKITHLCHTWEALLDLPGIVVRHSFSEATNDNNIAETSSLWVYRKADMTWYLPTCAILSADELEIAVIHEYVHVLMGPLKDRIKPGSTEHEEHATESVARALYSVYHKGL